MMLSAGTGETTAVGDWAGERIVVVVGDGVTDGVALGVGNVGRETVVVVENAEVRGAEVVVKGAEVVVRG